MTMKEREPGTWKPENEGDKIAGTYIGKDENVGDFSSTVYHLNTAEGLMSVWGSAALNPKMMGLKEGEKIEIEYVGTVPSKKGADTKLFKVYTDDGKDEEEQKVEEVKPEVPGN